ncbi:Assembly factor cbp-4 [Echria macrotheca]|uniref:Cytochrome b mRNA-processing protein 4 n=1 Tax=Echria macrotheca TaxID=438768 RepID=A0AAJ0F836_9PEZI|nr:Assembly factor cbp-4 [Echria macrotheca]
MVKKPVNWWLWTKMLVVGGVVCVGGPAVTMWLTPTDEELFKKYNPELQKRSLDRRYERQKEFDDFVTKLKEQSKSSKPIWHVQKEAEDKARKERIAEKSEAMAAERALQQERQKEMRREAGLSTE